ncbi:MAG: c-type cytochrome [Acidobacteriota bacterium]|nr:c-type cytochrome [Acidobacteriota bacterium]
MKLRIVSSVVVLAGIIAFGGISFGAQTAPDAAGLFKSKCSMCHGPDGKGYAAIHTPDFTSPKWQASITDKEIVTIITSGKKGTIMPAFSGKLKTSQIEELAHYIRSLKSAKKD